ncbi:hypothetical protein [Leptospira vanthielii]|uniref:Uncharacterized protein n=1 Tax=Leptospira vanthielii serovar Holland str. Waz Holland = ATCC 700522 TaxID=1218591 RepID=N1W0P3_9LEPT|nr:hypothetical protein [Leptospira vanthielii]EMY68603.1 hypothetical protein LEP1GSC199_0609 [Leptospira vanthielii serovar Holland str. Waz Holland = ATCC 700522]
MKVFHFAFITSITIAVLLGIDSKNTNEENIYSEKVVSILKIVNFKDLGGVTQINNSVYFNPKKIENSFLLKIEPNTTIQIENCEFNLFKDASRFDKHEYNNHKYILQTNHSFYLFKKVNFEEMYFYKFKFSYDINGVFHYDFYDCVKTSSLQKNQILTNYFEKNSFKIHFLEYLNKISIRAENNNLKIRNQYIIIIGFVLNVILFFILLFFLTNLKFMFPYFTILNICLYLILRFNDGH